MLEESASFSFKKKPPYHYIDSAKKSIEDFDMNRGTYKLVM